MKNNLFNYATALLITTSLFSCKKNEQFTRQSSETFKATNKTSAINPIISYTKNVNIVYFVPSDLDTLSGYRSRLNDLLLWGQDFYRTEMSRNGYSNKTFGLTNDGNGKVKIITIRGLYPKSTYPYSGGLAAVKSEVDAYFASHSSENSSAHTLIIIPNYTVDANGEPGGPPFFGYGRWCFALDYADFNIQYLGQNNTLGNRLTKWFGGMMHELGHGLNLPHDKQKVSEYPTLGTSLMGAGNYTLGKNPTFITAADAAVLNANQVFNNNNNTYYGAVTSNITKIYANYDAPSASIIVSGKFTSSGNVASILYFNDPNVNNEGTGTNKDYNAVTWESKKIGTDSFRVVMPISELTEKADGIPYELKVKLVHDNGIVNQNIYAYTFAGGIPVINFGTKPELSKTGWTIAGFSTQQNTTSESAANVLDNNPTTFWHSKWSGSPLGTYPHYLTIKLGSSKTAKGISYLHREGANRAIKNFEILTSTDGTNFTSRGNYATSNITSTQYFAFSSPQTFTHFKIIANSSWDGTQNAAIAELGLYN